MFLGKQEISFDLEKEKGEMKKVYEQLRIKIAAIDKSLEGSVSAEEKKALSGLDNLSQKSLRALKLKEEISINQLKQIRSKFFVDAVPQERIENFSGYYFIWGKEFLQYLKKSIDPFILEHIIISEI